MSVAREKHAEAMATATVHNLQDEVLAALADHDRDMVAASQGQGLDAVSAALADVAQALGVLVSDATAGGILVVETATERAADRNRVRQADPVARWHDAKGSVRGRVKCAAIVEIVVGRRRGLDEVDRIAIDNLLGVGHRRARQAGMTATVTAVATWLDASEEDHPTRVAWHEVEARRNVALVDPMPVVLDPNAVRASPIEHRLIGHPTEPMPQALHGCSARSSHSFAKCGC